MILWHADRGPPTRFPGVKGGLEACKQVDDEVEGNLEFLL